MHVQFLGAHNLESQASRYTSLLIDDVLAIEAGALTSSLSFSAQQKLKAILLSHQHYDHVRDIPAIGMNFWLHENTIDVYATQVVHEVLVTHLLNDWLYPDFTQKPTGKPAIRFKVIAPNRPEMIGGYSVLAVPVNHSVPTVGYQVTSTDGKTLFYTSDTGPGLAECWQKVSPELLIIEETAPNRYEDFAHHAGHFTPDLLRQEMETFRKLKGYLPQIVLVHMNPLHQKEIEAEIAAVAKSLDAEIQLSYEGMQINL
jgi:ribonuclease BN (tRNA processing enzyme)